MQGVLRTWSCQNPRCGTAFDDWNDYPPCPLCGCVKTNWLPGGGHIGNMAKSVDATFKDLAAAYGMTDIATARTGERAMPSKAPAAHDRANLHQFAPGFVGTPYTVDAAGQAHAVCMPSAASVNFKVKAPVGKRLSSSGNVPGPASNTRFEGSYKG